MFDCINSAKLLEKLQIDEHLLIVTKTYFIFLAGMLPQPSVIIKV